MNRRCLVLYDDLAAELDSNRRGMLLQALADLDTQTFLTCVDDNQLDTSNWQRKKMFHVEQGCLKELI